MDARDLVKACRFDKSTRACPVCGYVAQRLPLTRICRTPPAARAAEPRPSGPGDELHAILRDWLGIVTTPTCACRKMRNTMNDRGPEWCQTDGLAEIVSTMRTEHAQRWAAGKTRLPWIEAGARELVLLACRRSRDKASRAV